MRILFVEDDADFWPSVSARLNALPHVYLKHVKSKDTALAALDDASFDVVLCDLRIPSTDESLDDDSSHGQVVVDTCLQKQPGAVLMILTALQDQDYVEDLLNTRSQALNIWSSQNPVQMLRKYQKKRVDLCVKDVESLHVQFRTATAIALSSGVANIQLSDDEKSVVRIYCAQLQGNQAAVTALNGGFSESRVLKVVVRGADGGIRSTAAAKLSSLAVIREERRRYQEHIVRLEQGSFAHLQVEVLAGAGLKGGTFCAIAGADTGNLFQRVHSDEVRAVAAVDRLERGQTNWVNGVNNRLTHVADIRRILMPDHKFQSVRPLLRDIDVEAIEQTEVLAKACSQHNDLHGANVILSNDDLPVLIDYGDSGTSFAGIDAITVELSFLFHSQGNSFLQLGWPTDENLLGWTNLEVFTKGCNFPNFVRRCRKWAHESAGTDAALYAAGYAYAIRQLKYPDTNKDWALAIARSCGNAILAH